MPLTDREILGLKPKAKPYYAIDKQRERGKGALWLLVRPSGKKEFYYVYTLSGKRISIGLGPYSKANAGQGISLDEARGKKDELAAFLIQGLDPKEELARIAFEQEQEKRRQKQLGTVQQLFDGYVRNLEANGKRSFNEAARALRNDALPTLGKDTPAHQITSHEVKLCLHKMIQRGALISSNRLRSYLSAAFTYGLEHDNSPATMDAAISFQLTHNPVRDVPKALKSEKPRDRELSAAEIKRLWNEFNPTDRFSNIESILKLILATGGQRVGEVSQAKWEEFDLNKGVWEIPASRTKNSKAHLVPLNGVAMSLLGQLQQYESGSPFLYPHRLDDSKPLTLASISQAVTRFCREYDMEHFNPRDLRRTCKTKMGEIGLSKEIRDRINNHSLNDVSSKHYDRYDYLAEKQSALKAWGKYLTQILDSNLSNVIPIQSFA